MLMITDPGSPNKSLFLRAPWVALAAARGQLAQAAPLAPAARPNIQFFAFFRRIRLLELNSGVDRSFSLLAIGLQSTQQLARSMARFSAIDLAIAQRVAQR